MSCDNYDIGDHKYKPLPEDLTIKNSDIHGLGLFATKYINSDVELGISHIETNKNLIRTPLGGFINHSKDFNCVIVKIFEYYILITEKEIRAGEELTVDYSKYNCGKK
jgi:SET domain-containing protein